MSRASVASLQSLKLAQRRAGILRPGHGVLVFGAAAIRSGWASYASSVVAGDAVRHGDQRGNGFIVGVMETARIQRRHQGSDAEALSSSFGCAELLSGLCPLKLRDDPSPLVTAVTGKARAGDMNEESIFDVVLVDFCGAQEDHHAPFGDANDKAAAAAVNRRGASATDAVRSTMAALQACSGLMKRDVTLLCRVPAAAPIGGLLRGLRATFSELQMVVKKCEGDTHLLLARKARTAPVLDGVDKVGWEKYHRKLMPKAMLKANAFNPVNRVSLFKSKRHPYLQALASRNLDVMPPSRVARKQLESVRFAAKRAAVEDTFSNLASSYDEEAPPEKSDKW
jgi:hypothetical protein